MWTETQEFCREHLKQYNSAMDIKNNIFFTAISLQCPPNSPHIQTYAQYSQEGRKTTQEV